MKIASIALKDFRAYHDAEVSFDEPLSIIRGANHAGKTTLAQAVQLALTRRADGTTAAGAGADDKIRQGAKKAEIVVGLETRQGPVGVHVGYGKSGRSQGFTGVEGFHLFLAGNEDRLGCVLDSEYFIGQSEKEQKAILSALIAPKTWEFDPAIAPLIEKYLGRILEELTTPIEQIDWCYDRAFKERTKAKAALEAIRVPQPVPAPDYTVEKIHEHLEKLRGELDEERDRVVAATSTAAGDIARAEAAIQRKEQELEAQKDNLASARDRIRDAETNMLTGPQMTKAKKTAEGRPKWDEAEEGLGKVRTKIKALRESIDTVVELAGEEGECPTCKRLLDESAVDEVVDALKKQIAGLIASEAEWLNIQKDLGDVAGAEQKLADHERAKQSKLDWVRRQTAATEEMTRIGREIVDLNTQLNSLRSQTVAATAEPKDRTELKAKIEAWEKKLGEAQRYAVVQEQIVAAEANRRSHAEAVRDLERLVAYFGKDGVKADILKASIDGFTEQVNWVLDTWGYRAELSVEPYRFLVTTADGKTLPLKELSGSERLMFGVALQSAISIQSGIRLMVIDRADTFINGERGRLFQGVKSLLDAEMLDQVIVLVSDERTEVPEQPGVAFYRVAEGRIERLGRADEEAAA